MAENFGLVSAAANQEYQCPLAAPGAGWTEPVKAEVNDDQRKEILQLLSVRKHNLRAQRLACTKPATCGLLTRL